ncbi:MAG TPA: hypothetical protein VLA90_08490 [Actinomycetota bacterium]|nr:hypothetical protein [Actinomycetota bacterium]
MDEREASEILAEEIRALRACGYDELRPDFKLVARQVTGLRTGPTYTVEIEAFVDDPRAAAGDLRVVVSIDDGRGLRAFAPPTDDFLIRRDGSFVGE